jgi:hypothetical protein
MSSKWQGSITRIISAASIAVLFGAVARADSPREKYHAAFGPELRTALKGTIGALTISALRSDTAAVLKVYSECGLEPGRPLAPKTISPGQPSPRDTSVAPAVPEERPGNGYVIGVLNGTIPVSNFGYYPPFEPYAVDEYRYPITARQGRYLQLVIDPVDSRRRWLDLEEVEKDFQTRVVMFESLAAVAPGELFLDVFRFTPDRKCRLYKTPSPDADFKLMSEGDTPGYLLSVLEVRGGFARVGNYIVNIDNQLDAPRIVPLGWVRIWDDEGVPLIWIKNEDRC